MIDSSEQWQDMHNRFLRNREGRLTVDQWKEIVVEPIIKLLLLFMPIFVVLLPRLLANGRVLILIGVVILLVIVIPIPFRAWRYARIPVHYAILYADHTPPWWQFWKPLILYTKGGDPVKFQKKLTTNISLVPDSAYMLYYFEDPGSRVLLSIAPVAHVDADEWKPRTSAVVHDFAS